MTVLRRAGPLAVLAVVPALMVLVRLVVPLFLTRLPVWYQDLSLNAPAYFDSLRSAATRAGTDSIARRTADAIRVMLANDRIEAIRVPQIGKPALDNLPPRARADLDSAALRYPAPDSATVIAARAWLKGRVQMVRLNGGVSHVPDAFRQGMKALGFLGVVGVALALVLRGGLLFTLFGIALQRADGAPAGRLRCLARSLVAWAPFMVLTLVSQVNNVKVGLAQPGLSVTATSGPPAAPAPPPTRGSGLEDALIVLAVAGAGVAAFRPARGLAERIAGVVLVPK